MISAMTKRINSLRPIFSGIGSAELKYNRLARNGRYHERIIELVRVLASEPLRAGAWVAHKEYALMTLVVDWWMEPLAHKFGMNLYKDGATLATQTACEGRLGRAFASRPFWLRHFCSRQ
jgi:hypothetical protein